MPLTINQEFDTEEHLGATATDTAATAIIGVTAVAALATAVTSAPVSAPIAALSGAALGAIANAHRSS